MRETYAPDPQREGRRLASVSTAVIFAAALLGGVVDLPVDAVRGEPAAVVGPALDPLSPLTSPDVGDHCADGLGADDLSTFFSDPIGEIGGGDYQRAIRLPDDRVLWTLQDAFVGRTLVHNVGLIQSGRCFSILDRGGAGRSWLLGGDTVPMRRWHWILGGDVGAGGASVHLFVAEMAERGRRYLDHVEPVALRRVVLDLADLDVIALDDVPIVDGHLYGWSVTSTADHTYLYSHCYRQFGHAGMFGIDECSAEVRVGRVPRGRFGEVIEFWTGTGWSENADTAVAVVDGRFIGSGNNPAQIVFDGSRFVLVEKRDDWWGRTVEFGTAAHPSGPFVHSTTVDEPLSCDRSACNTYFASWLPWRDDADRMLWAIGHNRWNGSETVDRLADYRPSIHVVDIGP